MKTWLFVAVGVMFWAASLPGATVQLTDYLNNTGFDMAWTVTGYISEFESGFIQSSPGNSWQGTTIGRTFYIHSYSNVEDTSPSMAYIHCDYAGDDQRIWQDVGTSLVTGTTYQVSFKYRQFAIGSDVRAPSDLTVAWGLYDGTLGNPVTIPSSQITPQWQTMNYTFTYDGSRGTPDRWALVFKATGTQNGWSGVSIDSLAPVPEPATIGLLVCGLLGIRRRLSL